MHEAPVDFILTHGRFTTLDPSVLDPEAVAIAAGRFAAVGDFDDLIGEAGPTTRIVDLGGRRAIPSPLRSQVTLSMTGAWIDRGESAPPLAALHRWTAMAWLVSGHDKLTRMEALQLWVDAGAATLGPAGAGGAIRTGRAANLIVLSADLMTAPEAEILDIVPDLVLFEGKVVLAAGPFQALAGEQGLPIADRPPVRVATAGMPIIGRRK